MALLTFSPCESFLPIYLSGVEYGWYGFAILSAILAVGTFLGMVSLTFVSMLGLNKLRLTAIEKYESLLMGLLLCFLGVLLIFIESH